MSHTPARLAGLAAMLAALILAPPAIAGAAANHGASAKAGQSAKQCKSKAKRARAACAKKVAKAKRASTRAGCAGLSRKRTSGQRNSAYARCVKAGTKVVSPTKQAALDAAKLAELDAADLADELAAERADGDSADPDDDRADAALSDRWADGGGDDDGDTNFDVIDPALDGPDTT